MVNFAMWYALFLWVLLLFYAPTFTIGFTIIIFAILKGNDKPVSYHING